MKVTSMLESPANCDDSSVITFVTFAHNWVEWSRQRIATQIEKFKKIIQTPLNTMGKYDKLLFV